MWRVRHWLVAVLCCVAAPLAAVDLTLPTGAVQTASRDRALAQEPVPTGAFAEGAIPTRVFEGPVSQRAFRIQSAGLTPLQILAPLRAQLEAAEYDILLDCDEGACGGCDFRFALVVLPAPNMYVIFRAYHFLSAASPDGQAAVTLLASAAPGAGYLQILQIGESTNIAVPNEPEPLSTVTTADTPLGTRLLSNGHVVLASLEFAVGTTALNGTDVPELAQIAGLMEARPGLRIAVVGHTDTVGGLEANIAVSRARAQSVRRALIESYGVAPARIEANGMGYLSPVASNLTEAGREANRRVEVVILEDAG